jgi:hypothetical protein
LRRHGEGVAFTYLLGSGHDGSLLMKIFVCVEMVLLRVLMQSKRRRKNIVVAGFGFIQIEPTRPIRSFRSRSFLSIFNELHAGVI